MKANRSIVPGRRLALVLGLTALVASACGGDDAGGAPRAGSPEKSLSTEGSPFPTAGPSSAEPDSDITADLPLPDTPGPGQVTCPSDQRVLAAYGDHLSKFGVGNEARYAVDARSSCSQGWRAAVLREQPTGSSFVVVVGPNIGGRPLAVVADGTDRDKGGPCAVAGRAHAPDAVLQFCRIHD